MRSSFEGMEGMVGLTAGASGGLGGVYADRIDLPFVTIECPAGKPISENFSWVPRFPLSNWTSEWYCWLALTEFVKTKGWDELDILKTSDGRDLDWAKNTGGDADWSARNAQEVVAGELRDLVTMARNERPDALAEILGQSTEFVSYFLNILSAPDSHPATARLLRIANFIGGFCAMYYKGKYRRPRPSMLCPALLPPIAVPGHASFPSGHSTQAHLIVRCMIDVLANRPDMLPVQIDMLALADRIARNREIAGLHYSSDTGSGIYLAGQVHGLLNPSADSAGKQTPWYKLALSAAQKEWALSDY